MKLSKLIEKLHPVQVTGNTDIDISSVEYNSAKVIKDTLFICIKGFKVDGHSFISDAKNKGAAAFIVEDMPSAPVDATLIQVKDSREALALTAAAWFGYPAEKMTMIGLTGTKGKTTTAFMTKKILEEAGHKVGMIGTVGAYIGDEKIETKNTTPESFELHSLFSRMVSAGCSHVVMEASSQGFKLKRTAGITFDYGAFLNLSPDHISPEEHADFNEYRDCKKMMFDQTKKAIVNIDSEHWEYVTSAATDSTTISTEKPADLTAADIKSIWEPGILGSSFTAAGLYTGEITLNMPGAFNVHNALIAMAIAANLGIDFETVKRALLKVSVKGRTQLIPEASHLGTFIIDYAHNALSTESLLSMLKSYHPERLICLFGAGGNRDKQRRYDMGLAAGKYADLSILTTDNPRWEDPNNIISHIIEGMEVHHGAYKVILDRTEAIHYVMDHCRKNDIVALLGKGHEEYQEVEGVKHHFSEEEIIKEYAQVTQTCHSQA